MEVDLLETLIKITSPASELGQAIGTDSQNAINIIGQLLPALTKGLGAYVRGGDLESRLKT